MPPPPDLPDDAISEVLLRLPPDEPQWLFRAALVCKPWLRTLSDPAFLRRYRDFHRTPPLLGLVEGKPPSLEGRAHRFVPTTAVPALPIPVTDDHTIVWPLDCRHGRALFRVYGRGAYYLVCDPVTGDRQRVPKAERWIWRMDHGPAAVICAAAGCDHGDCHGGPFFLVVMLTDRTTSPPTMWMAMYSSEIGVWRAPVMLELDNAPYAVYSRGLLIGDEIYFAHCEAAKIVKYDWANNLLSVVKPRPPAMHNGFTLMVMEDRLLGLAATEDSRLHLWSRRVGSQGIADQWVRCRVIDLEKLMPMAKPREFASAIGFAEGVGAIFISTGVGLFMMELKSGRVRKVDKPGNFSNVLPYMSFYAPDRLLGRPADLRCATSK